MRRLNSELIKNEVIKLLVNLKHKNTGNTTDIISKNNVKVKKATYKKNSWQLIKNVATKTIMLAFSRANSINKPRINGSAWSSIYSFKLRIKGRFYLRLNYITEKNPQTRAARLQRYRVYQRLFAYGYLASIAHSFFMQKTSTSTFYQNSYFGLKYNLVFADLIMFKLWSLRKFIMRPIYMKRLFCLSLGSVKKKQITRTLAYIRRAKKNRISKFFKFFQYSLYSLVSQSFKLMNLDTLLIFIKAGFFTVNGQIITNPLYACETQDLIQFNVFYLFKQAEYMELEPSLMNSLKHKSVKLKDLTMFFLLTFFHNTILYKPVSKRRRYKTTSTNVNSWLKAFDKKRHYANQWNLQTFFKLIGPQSKQLLARFSAVTKKTDPLTIVYPPISALNLLSKFHPLSYYMLVLNNDEKKINLKKKVVNAKVIVKKTIFSVLNKMNTHSVRLRTYLTLGYFLNTYLDATEQKFRLKKKLKTIKKFGVVTRVFKVRGQSRIKKGWAFMEQSNRSRKRSIIKHNILHLVKQRRNTVFNKSRSSLTARTVEAVVYLRHSRFNQTYNLLVDNDVFAVNILNQHKKNKGKRQFLNQATARFLLAFCTKA